MSYVVVVLILFDISLSLSVVKLMKKCWYAAPSFVYLVCFLRICPCLLLASSLTLGPVVQEKPEITPGYEAPN